MIPEEHAEPHAERPGKRDGLVKQKTENKSRAGRKLCPFYNKAPLYQIVIDNTSNTQEVCRGSGIWFVSKCLSWHNVLWP